MDSMMVVAGVRGGDWGGGAGVASVASLPPPRSAGDRILPRWSARRREVGRGGDSGWRGSLGGQVASAAPPTSSQWQWLGTAASEAVRRPIAWMVMATQ
jgi:hypothetical protein